MISFIKTGGYYNNITQVGNNYVIVIVFIKTIGYYSNITHEGR